MTLHRDAVWNIVFVLVALGAGAWFVSNTYWDDERVRDAARGEAATDTHYAAKKLIEHLGGRTVSPTNLDRLPPVGATLVLNSWNYDLFPERDQKLRAWVESGGHLVSEQWKRPAWLNVDNQTIDRKRRRAGAAGAPASGDMPAPATEPATEPASEPEPKPRTNGRPPRGNAMRPPAAADCFVAHESTNDQLAFDRPRDFRLCATTEDRVLVSKTAFTWTLEGRSGPVVARLPIGRGMATLATAAISDNHELFEGEQSAAFVAMLDLRRRPEVWFVDAEQRDPLLKLVWRHGKPAVLIGFGLIALALWRALLRFGPRAPVPPLSRRSVAEQIRGTSSFIFQRDGDALLQAQWRALEQAGRRSIRDHDKLDRRARAEAIARATALDANALARALDPALRRHRRDLLATLALLETAARRLTLNR
jgi:hypothetical protein